MGMRQNAFDVSSTVDTTDPMAVSTEVAAVYADLYQKQPPVSLGRAFTDLGRLYRGEYPGYHACDTAYHDIQHVLEVTLAMARLVDGYERSRAGTPPMGEALFRLGVIVALYHDCGYVRELTDLQHKNGAELILSHVSRGAIFLKRYLPVLGMAEFADIAAELIHFTGFERHASGIKVPSAIYRLLGNMLGTADIIAQMADRCYLEKCRDRLYPEFVAGGIAVQRAPDGSSKVLFSSGMDLVMKTPGFFNTASKRLNEELAGSHAYAEKHFGGQNLYIEGAEKNVRFVEAISGEQDPAAHLTREPPETLPGSKSG